MSFVRLALDGTADFFVQYEKFYVRSLAAPQTSQ